MFKSQKRKSSELKISFYFYFLDIDYLLKTEAYPNTPFADCSNKSCLNGGYCLNVSTEEYICHCPVHFTGRFIYIYFKRQYGFSDSDASRQVLYIFLNVRVKRNVNYAPTFISIFIDNLCIVKHQYYII